MIKQEKTSLKSQHKKKLKEKRFKNLAAQLRLNILKRKKNKLANKNG